MIQSKTKLLIILSEKKNTRNEDSLTGSKDKRKQPSQVPTNHGNIEIIERPLRRHKRHTTELFENKNKLLGRITDNSK